MEACDQPLGVLSLSLGNHMPADNYKKKGSTGMNLVCTGVQQGLAPGGGGLTAARQEPGR